MMRLVVLLELTTEDMLRQKDDVLNLTYPCSPALSQQSLCTCMIFSPLRTI